MPFRVLKQNLLTNHIEPTIFHFLHESYSKCIPDTSHHCLILYHYLQQKVESGKILIRVSCYNDVVYWIEVLYEDLDSPLPALPWSKIECGCHPK
jgi:hypothetical protein